MKINEALGKLNNRMNEVTYESLKLGGWGSAYIEGYLDCKNWLKSEILSILEAK